MRYRWTVYRKIQVITTFVLILIFAISQFTVSNLVSNTVESAFQNNGENTAVLLQKNIGVLFDDASNSLELIKNQFESSYKNDEEISDYLRILKETKPYIINAFVAYEDSSYIIEPFVEIDEDFDPTEREWFQTAYNTRVMQWSQPYIDVATNDIVITGSLYVPFKNTYGVIGLDINLKDLPGFLSITEISENGFILLVDKNNNIILDSRQVYTGENLDIIDDEKFLESNLISGYIKTKSGFYYLRSFLNTDMRLIAYIPSSDLKAAMYGVQILSSAILLSALILGLLVSRWLLRRITKPIEDLTQTILKATAENRLLSYEGSTNDEIKTLIDGYNAMVKNVNHQKNALEELSSDLVASEKKLQEQYNKVSDMAYFDYLTNLPNRASFEESLRKKITERQPFALMYIDLDNFKYINDTYGHNYGDQALKQIGDRIRTCENKDYFPSRLSGDEFGIIFGYETTKDIEEMSLSILKKIETPMVIHQLSFKMTSSIGISIFPDDGLSSETLFSNADIAMYESKKNSKNQYKIFKQSFRKDLINRVNIETALSDALENNEIYLCYQPLIDYSSKGIVGFEALARFNSKKLGNIPPDVFIPIAEHNLDINPLGSFIMSTAIKFGKELFITYGRYYEMNVNVSAIQLHHENFLGDVLKVLETFDYPPEFLNLEITESVALNSDQVIHEKLKILRSYGIGISIDDFGTGYSSLNHLIDLELSHLKIDRDIIIRATHDKIVYKLIQGIVDFAHAMSLKVVAEGIEDERMAKLMGDLHVDLCQGYLYARPLTEEGVADYLN